MVQIQCKWYNYSVNGTTTVVVPWYNHSATGTTTVVVPWHNHSANCTTTVVVPWYNYSVNGTTTVVEPWHDICDKLPTVPALFDYSGLKIPWYSSSSTIKQPCLCRGK